MGDIYADSCLKIERTYDLNLVRTLIYSEDLEELSTFNNATKAQVEEGLSDERKEYYICYCDNNIAGIVIFLNFTEYDELAIPNTYFVDIGIFKKFRGKIGWDLARLMLNIFFNNHYVYKLFAVVSANNFGCISFAKKLGFGVIERENNYFLLEAKRGKVKWAG